MLFRVTHKEAKKGKQREGNNKEKLRFGYE